MKTHSPKSRFRIAKDLFGILSTREFLIWLIGGWIMYYVSSAIWTEEAFASFLAGVRQKPFMQIPFALFLMSGYLNLIRVSRGLFQKSRVQFTLWLFLPAGILLLFTGFFISITTRQSDWLIAGQDYSVKPKWSNESYRISSIDPGLKERFLDIEIHAGKGIFQYEPKLTLLDSSSRTFEIGAFPPAKIDDTYFHILTFGLAPGMSFSEKGEIRDEGYMPLRILMPGSSDNFMIQPYPYKFLLTMAPERTFQKGSVKASQFNLKDPFFTVRVYKGGKVISEGDSRAGIRFDDYTLNFFDSTFWIQLEFVKDPGMPVIRLGIACILVGIPLAFVLLIVKHFMKNPGAP